MKKILFILIGLVLSFAGIGELKADDLKNNFQANMNQDSIDALTKDLGALVGGGSFHTGKALGFPLGFDVGAHAVAVKLQDKDTILRDDSSSANAIYAQAEVGLPFSLNVIGRMGSVGDAKVYGGGLRYGILRPSIPGLPDLSISALYNKLDHDFITLTNYAFNAALSFDFPIIHPYIGAGYDVNDLKVESKAYVGAPANTPAGLKSNEGGYRAEIGLNLSIIPFTYITLAGGLANGEAMYHAGLGVTF